MLNYFNRGFELESLRAGFDVRTTESSRDYLGGQHTYDSHMGTDFVCPVGTRVVAPASGTVRRVENLMHRGGLKVVIDHGGGVITWCNHLARTHVRAGDEVERGQVIGLSGLSSVDGVLFFPWLPPHVHFTVTLGGTPVDPFAVSGETSLWRTGNAPVPARRESSDPLPTPAWNREAMATMAASCTDRVVRAELESAHDIEQLAALAVYWRAFAYTKFAEHPALTVEPCQRVPLLDLPLHPEDIVGIDAP